MINSFGSICDMDKEKNIQMLVAQITGNSSRKDEKEVENWINESGENLALYEDLKRVWNYSTAKETSQKFNVDMAWEKFKNTANFESVPANKHFKIRKPVIRKIATYVSGIAASIIILFGMYFFFDKDVSTPEYINYSSSVTQTDSPYLLPDGTAIIMNKGSEITYPEQFSSDVREVSFKGEAFFNVAHNPDKPMVISTDNIRVEVLGTSFDLCNCVNSDEISVYLETGKVLFCSVDPETNEILERVEVLPGQKAVYSKSLGMIETSEIFDSNHLAWKTGIIDFVATPMPDVLKVIANTYRVNIETEVSIDDMIVTARYENESPESILEALSVIFGINYEISDKNIRVY